MMMNKKQYSNKNILTNKKNIIVCINYALLGFYLYHFERYECVEKLNCV